MDQEPKTVRCAVIGTGVMGKQYAAIIDDGEIEGLSLAAVCCRSERNIAWAKERLSAAVRICPDEDKLYEQPDSFDAVLVVTPHKAHPAMVLRALEAGKHVMCDKPVAVTTADAEKMNEAAARAGTVYAMMCHQRTYARHEKIRQLLQEGAVGEVVRMSFVSSRFYRTWFYHCSSAWRSSWRGEGGGALMNQGHHLLDLWQYLFGLPESVYAEIPFGKYHDFAVDDEATLVLRYPGGVTGTFLLTTGEGAETERLEIIGTGGKILMESGALTLIRFSEDLRDYTRSAQVVSREELRQTEEHFTYQDADSAAYRAMLRNFSAAIRQGAPLVSPGTEGIKTLELINAAYLSAWEGRRVTLPVDKARYAELLSQKEELE